MIFLFYFFAAISTFFGYKSLRSGVNYLNYFKKESSKPESDFAPFSSIIAPCRGLDAGLSENLAALFRQNYPNYEVVFAVDDDKDKAVSIIKELIYSNRSIDAKLIISPDAIDSSQKVENLREAVLHVSAQSEVFVFVDSDARPNENWLKNLVAPLEDETIGAATGYRWFVTKRGGFSAHLLSVWNASIASALGANADKNFCWGGATAIRRETFEKLDVREKWCGTVSDDFALTRALKEADLPIRFAPRCLTVSFEDCSFRGLLEFTTRQIKITRVYAPYLWRASFIGSFLFMFTFWSGIALLFFASGFHFWLTFVFLLIIFALGAAKARLRLDAVKLVLSDYEKELNRQFFPHVALWTISPVVYFFNCCAALISRKITWRGIRYELKSPRETVIISSDAG